jgi:hypothetical protein
MAKRFNNLKAALKLLRPLSGTGDTPDLADTSALGFFQAIQAGKKDVKYTRTGTESNPKSLVTYALTPFATPSKTAPKVLTTMSERSEGRFANTGVTTVLLGVSKEKATTEVAVQLFRFEPARATVSVKGATPSDGGSVTTEATSKLTGRKYKKVAKNSYTYPMGVTFEDGANVTNGNGFKDSKVALVRAIEAKGASVSFKPERYE